MQNINNQNDVFKQAIDDAIHNLQSLEQKIDDINKKISDTKSSFIDAGDGVKSLSSAINSLDGRKTKKLLTLSKNLKDVISSLKNMSYFESSAKEISTLVEKMNEISNINININTDSIDKLADSIENVNEHLKDFLKLSKGVSAVNLQKLINMGIKFEDTDIKKSNKNKGLEPDEFVKKIRRSGFGKHEANVKRAEIDFNKAPTRTKAGTLAKERLGYGYFHEKINADIMNSTVEQHIEALKLYEAAYEEYVEIAEKAKDTTEISTKNIDKKIDILNSKIKAGKGKEEDIEKLTDLKKFRGDFDKADNIVQAMRNYELKMNKFYIKTDEHKRKQKDIKKKQTDILNKKSQEQILEEANRTIDIVNRKIKLNIDSIKDIGNLVEAMKVIGEFSKDLSDDLTDIQKETEIELRALDKKAELLNEHNERFKDLRKEKKAEKKRENDADRKSKEDANLEESREKARGQKAESLGKIDKGLDERGDITKLIKAMEILGEFKDLDDKLEQVEKLWSEFNARQDARSKKRKNKTEEESIKKRERNKNLIHNSQIDYYFEKIRAGKISETNIESLAKLRLERGDFKKYDNPTQVSFDYANKLIKKYIENPKIRQQKEKQDEKDAKNLRELEELRLKRKDGELEKGDVNKYIKLSNELGLLGELVEDIRKNSSYLKTQLEDEIKAREDAKRALKELEADNKRKEKKAEKKRENDAETRLKELDKLNKKIAKYEEKLDDPDIKGLTHDQVREYTLAKKERGDYLQAVDPDNPTEKELGDERIRYESHTRRLIESEDKKTESFKEKEASDRLLKSVENRELRKELYKEADIESLKKEVSQLDTIIKSGNYEKYEAQKYVNAKFKTGGYSDGKLLSELSDDEIVEATTKRKEELKSLLANSKEAVNYDEIIDRLDANRKATAEQRKAERQLINTRTQQNTYKKLVDAQNKLKFDSEHQMQNALARVFQQTFGSNSPILQDLIEASGIMGKEFKSTQVLKDERAEIEADYNNKIRALTNEEMTRKQQIKLSGLSNEQNNLLNNKNLNDEQRQKIIDSALSQENVVNQLKELDEELYERREELNTDTTEKLIENEKAINLASLKAAGAITKYLIAFKILTKSLDAIWKASKKAAESNANMVSSLKTMGASANEINSASIYAFTNDLKNVEQRLKSIGRNLGDTVAVIGTGWLYLFDEILKGIDWVTEKLSQIPGFFGGSLKVDSEKAVNYSTKTLESIATKLDKGIDVNGVEVKIDKEVAYRALSNTFGQSKVQGFSNDSSANLSSLISQMATQVQANYGVDYEIASQQISDAIFNGSNSASAYGIVIDEQILAGYAALEKELDIVNVQYTDAYKSALRYEMAEKMMADGNSKEMQDKIKQWKQLGDVIQTASGTLFDFQEVQSIDAKDFTIPEIGAKGGIVDDANSYNELNKQLAETGDIFVMTSKGMMTFKEALDFINGDLSKFQLLMNKSTGEMILATNDYLPSLTQAEQNLYDTINTGVPAIATYARHIGLTDEQMINLARNSGIAEEKIGALRVALDELTSKGYIANFNYSSITEAKNEALALNEALANAGYYQNGEVNPDMQNSYASELSKYTEPIQKYVNNGYKFSDGSTVADMDGDGNTAWYDLGDYWQWLINKEKREGFNDFLNVGNYGGYGINPEIGHANGGLSFKEHTARISEGNAKEVILPLNSQETMSTLAGAISMSGIMNAGGGVNVENININNDGINIADNNQAWRRVATRLADELSTLQRERGDLNYGIR